MDQSSGHQNVTPEPQNPVFSPAELNLEPTSEPASSDPIESEVPVPPGTDFGWAITALIVRRDDVLTSWLETARAQPFHAAHPERTVSDDIPRLYDAVVEFLTFSTSGWRSPGSPIDHPSVLSAANSHARARAEQGLQPSDIVTEFRILRRAIWKGLRDQLGDLRPTGDVISAELLVNDAIDGAITVGLAALTSRIEEIREDFLVATIHDIRQPITTIKGLVQLSHRYLSRENPEILRARTALTDIATQVDQLNGTIDYLIDVSRAALGQLSLQLSPVDLSLLIPEIVRQSAVHHLREIRLSLPEEGLATGEWDAMRIRQVMANILSNALKYSPPGSPIDIEVRASTEFAEVLIRDYGMGLDATDLSKIFHRYYRTSSAIEGDLEGSGIGLYLCAQIIEAHRGKIWAESNGPGHGATVHFTLPRTAPEQTF